MADLDSVLDKLVETATALGETQRTLRVTETKLSVTLRRLEDRDKEIDVLKAKLADFSADKVAKPTGPYSGGLNA